MGLLEIRRQFLNDHATLRGKVSVLRSLALSVMRGDEELSSALRRKGQDLQEHLQRHMTWEEAQLLPMLDRANPRGVVTATALLEEHSIQRDRLAVSLRSLEVSDSPSKQLAKTIMELISWIERDMAQEEEAVMAVIAQGSDVEPDPGKFKSGAQRD